MNNTIVVKKLAKLRRDLEKGTEPLADLELPAALLLGDVCKALGLTTRERLKVLGKEATSLVDKLEGTRVSLAE